MCLTRTFRIDIHRTVSGYKERPSERYLYTDKVTGLTKIGEKWYTVKPCKGVRFNNGSEQIIIMQPVGELRVVQGSSSQWTEAAK